MHPDYENNKEDTILDLKNFKEYLKTKFDP